MFCSVCQLKETGSLYFPFASVCWMCFIINWQTIHQKKTSNSKLDKRKKEEKKGSGGGGVNVLFWQEKKHNHVKM